MWCMKMKQRGNNPTTENVTTIATPCFRLDGCFHVFHYWSPKVLKQIIHHGGCWYNFQIFSFLHSATPIYPNIGGSVFLGSYLQTAWHVEFHCVWLRPHFHQQIFAGNFQAPRHITPTKCDLSSPNLWLNRSSQKMFGELSEMLHIRQATLMGTMDTFSWMVV